MASSPAALSRHPLGRNLGADLLNKLVECARDARFREGELIFREGTPADTLFLLQQGRVALEQHIPGRGPLQVEELRAGDILGLTWMFPGEKWTLDARAVQPVESIALEAECVRDLMQGQPALSMPLATHLIERLYQRLVRARLQRLDVYRTEA